MGGTPQTWIAHVDLDAFFASCEQRDHPDYRGKPVMVGALPGGRGVVAAASYEARRFGVHSAMPIGEAYRRCPDGVYLRPNLAKYSEISQQIFTALEAITPAIEKASIDEAYLDISGLERVLGTPAHIGTRIKTLIRDATGLTASVGIGPNRLIAKLGSEFRKPDGLTIVPPDEVLDFLAPLPVCNLRGNGRVTQQKFAGLGIETIGQVREADTGWLARHLGRRAADHFQRQANGIASSHVETGSRRKSISKERTFQRDQTSPECLRDELRLLAQQVAATARRKQLAGKVVRIKVRFSNFETITRQRALRTATHDDRLILDTAWALFTAADVPARPVRLIGVGISDWGDAVDAQTDLFAEPARAQSATLLHTIDQVAERFGSGKLQRGMGKKH